MFSLNLGVPLLAPQATPRGLLLELCTQCLLLSCYAGYRTLEKKKGKSIASSMALNIELLDLLAAYVLSNWAVLQSH